ncbi:MAG TPA: sugar transferase [Candidatus Paceibacterota bacterium]|nr:sugar transferase [Candidatus Paceibacterota bacterium]
MKLPAPIKISLLVIGDIAAYYAALLVGLFLRYQNTFIQQFSESHALPFTLMLPLWLAVLYIAGLYDLSKLRNNLDFLKTLFLAIAISGLLTIAIFYLVTTLGIAPKRTLFVFLVVFAIIEAWWRRTFNIRASFREGLSRVLLLDASPRAKELFDELRDHPQMGYDVRLWLKEGFHDPAHTDFRKLVRDHEINLIVVPAHLKYDAAVTRTLYELMGLGIEIRDVPTFYEMVFRKIPIHDITESWFIDHALGERKFYDDLKRGLEIVGALLLAIILSPLLLLIAILVKLSSPGPVIYSQTRIGKHGRKFTFYKFRSMPALAPDGSAETNGAQWAPFGDKRATPIGRFLRATHLDELPQLWNILRGDLSFVGPRPERPEFVKKLEQEVRFYNARHLITPGITGWAQINYRADTTTTDVEEKIKHDLYYLKNRSLIFDAAIILKTIKSLIFTPR